MEPLWSSPQKSKTENHSTCHPRADRHPTESVQRPHGTRPVRALKVEISPRSKDRSRYTGQTGSGLLQTLIYNADFERSSGPLFSSKNQDSGKVSFYKRESDIQPSKGGRYPQRRAKNRRLCELSRLVACRRTGALRCLKVPASVKLFSDDLGPPRKRNLVLALCCRDRVGSFDPRGRGDSPATTPRDARRVNSREA